MKLGVHGGDIYSHGALEGKEILDYSSNINPLGVPKSFKENIEEAFDLIDKYPDIMYRNVRSYLVDYIREYWDEEIKSNEIVLGNGAGEIIDLSLKCLKKVIILTPSFAEYEDSARKWGAEIVEVKLTEDMDYDYEAILKELNLADGIILGNPNNPNGNVINREKFMNILDYCEANGKKVIIDEAFIEFHRECSLIDLIKEYKCILIIRAITKFFALPGIRFGYGICSDEDRIKSIEKAQIPWNINTFNEIALKYILKDRKYIESTIEWIKTEEPYMRKELETINFIEKVYTSKSNFILIKLKEDKEDELFSHCINNGLLIRRCSTFKGLEGSYIRLAIKDREKNKKALEILKMFNVVS